MKEGDKLYCKNSLTHADTIFFEESNSYIIIGISDNCKIIKLSDIFNASWYFELSDDSNDVYKFNDYFVTLQEYRKLKLKKLNQIR